MVTKGYQKGVYDRVTEGTEQDSLKRCKLAPIQRSMQTARQRRDTNRLIPQIDAIGFASVMLVLLFILMLPFMAVRPSHNYRGEVDLAKVRHPIPMPGANREDAIIISVTRDAKVYLRGTEVTLPELPAKINEMVKNGSPKVVYFKVDGRARYRYLGEVLDSVRSCGLEKVAFLVWEQKAQVIAN